MIVTGIVFALLLCLAGLLWRMAVRAPARIASSSDWERSRFFVNVDSLALLLDEQEERYLRRSLPAPSFRNIQRQRIRLAIQMLERVGKNSTMLLQLSERAALDADQECARAARQVSRTAARVRIQATFAVVCLSIKWLFPSTRIRVPKCWLEYQWLIEQKMASVLSGARYRLSSP